MRSDVGQGLVRGRSAGRDRRSTIAFLMLSSVATALSALIFLACGAGSSSSNVATNLLAGMSPWKSSRVSFSEALTDGVIAKTGDRWRSELTTVFHSDSSFVEYDLGRTYDFRAAFLQGDNNDSYVISLSEDGSAFSPLFVGEPTPERGLRARAASDLSGRGRYVRISVEGGDERYALSEVQLFSEPPAAFPPKLSARYGLPWVEVLRSHLLLLGLSGVVFFVTSSFRLGLIADSAALGWLFFNAYELVRTLFRIWPMASREVSLARATTAGVAAAVVLGVCLARGRFRPRRAVVIGLLSLCAAVSLLSFYNFGQPQFVDHRTGEPSFVHQDDMRVYFPVAKYYEELGFDGLYLGSIAAYVDDDSNVSLSSLAETELRDLQTHRIVRVGKVEPQIDAVKQRFSKERWQSFKQDMRYFRLSMGEQNYLATLTDHGANATPVWFCFARALFAFTPASDTILLIGAALDILLLGCMFVAIWRSFGLPAMLVSMIVFGSTDFYMFGSNWAGATLRHDWLAYLGLGVCALRVGRYTTGGALLALSAMIRAFPALALFGASIPIAFSLFQPGAPRPLKEKLALLVGHPKLRRIALGALVCVVVTAAISSLVFSVAAWRDWLEKVSLLNRDGAVNETSLRALLAGTGYDQRQILLRRWPLVAISVAVALGAVVLASRRKRIDQAAVLGLLLVPVVLNIVNYYLHFICLLPVLSAERQTAEPGTAESGEDVPLFGRAASNFAILLALCVVQYWTVLETDAELHFQYATVLFFACAALITWHAWRTPAATLAQHPAQDDGKGKRDVAKENV